MPKLLIVDDERDITEFARNFFRKRDIDVYTSSSGDEALKIIHDEHPDLVLLDVRMEKMSGIEVLQRLKENEKDIKIIMVSGVEEPEVVTEAKRLGVLGFIHKPLVIDELEKIVLKELQTT